MTWQKVQRLKSKFSCFWLRWTCFGRTNCNSLFYEYSFSGHDALGTETSKVDARCVGSKRPTSGLDERSECALTWPVQPVHKAFQPVNSYMVTEVSINQYFYLICCYILSWNTITQFNYIYSDDSFQGNQTRLLLFSHGCQLVLNWNISRTIGWITMRFGVNIHTSTFPRVPSSDYNFSLFNTIA